MFDFIKSNKTIFSLIFIALFIMLLIFGIMLFMGGRQSTSIDNQEVFPDTTTNRGVDPTDLDLFGPTDAERWLGDVDTQSEAPVFRALTEIPVANAVVFERSDGTTLSPYVRYVALNDGNVYETPLNIVGTEESLSIENIHRIGDVLWSENANTLLTRYYGDDKNTIVHSRLGVFMRGSSTENTRILQDGTLELTGRQLEENITSAAFSPDGSAVFYLVENNNGTEGYIESVKTGVRTSVWESIFKDLTVYWDTRDMIVIYKNPSSVSEGVVWLLDTETLEYNSILGKELALAAKMNPQGDKILYSMQESKNSVFSLRVLDMETGDHMILPVEGMVDKCSWGMDQYVFCALPKENVSGGFLEKWYMGIQHTNDALWRIDVRNGNIKKLLDPEEEVGEPFDIINLEVAPNGDYLVFVSRVNNALWALKLPANTTSGTQEELE